MRRCTCSCANRRGVRHELIGLHVRGYFQTPGAQGDCIDQCKVCTAASIQLSLPEPCRRLIDQNDSPTNAHDSHIMWYLPLRACESENDSPIIGRTACTACLCNYRCMLWSRYVLVTGYLLGEQARCQLAGCSLRVRERLPL